MNPIDGRMASALGGDVRAGLDAFDEAGADLVATTERWSAINSGSREIAGLARMEAVLLPALERLGAPIERVALAPTPVVRGDGTVAETPHGAALRVRVRPEAPLQIALTGHYDTVFPAASPFQAPERLDGGVLRGPGVADMKGGIAIMLAALEAFEATPDARRVGFEVLLSPDEEIGSPASAPLLAELGARAHVGMTYEPGLPDGAVVGARKGSGNFSLVLTGRAAHVGRAFADGRSAIAAAADAVLRIEALNERREGVTFNCGSIEGGAPVNMVPEGAVVRFNLRAPDDASRDWAMGEVRAIVAAIADRPGIGAHLHGGFTRPPKPLTPSQETLLGFVRAAGADLGLSIAVRPSGGVCEGNNLAAAGCPNVDTLGPCGGNLHSPEEYALMSSFAERAKLSFLLLAGFASGRFDVRGLRNG
jgi:glutamate carboxypeptidase